MAMRTILNHDAGATMIEYALIASFIALVAISALAMIAPALIPTYTSIGNTL